MKRLIFSILLTYICLLPTFANETIKIKEIEGLNDITKDINSHLITKADITILGLYYSQTGSDYFKYCYTPLTLTNKPSNFSLELSNYSEKHNEQRKEYYESDYTLKVSFDIQLSPTLEKKPYRITFIPTKISNSINIIKGKLTKYDYQINNAYAAYVERGEIPEKVFGPFDSKSDDTRVGFEAICDSMMEYNSIPINLKPYAQNLIKIESRQLCENGLNLNGYYIDEDGKRGNEYIGKASCRYEIYGVVNSLTFIDGSTKLFHTGIIDANDWVSHNQESEIRSPWEGKGTKENPFLIKNTNDLTALINNYSFIDRGFFFKQENDIYLTNSDLWGKPTENLLLYKYEKPFKGHYDGNNKTISGIKIITSDKEIPTLPKAPFNNHHGLFHRVRNAEIKNLTLNCEIDIENNNIAGGLAGEANNATFTNIIINSTIKGNESIGGLIGEGTNISFNNITVKSDDITGKKFIGGILGKGERITANNINLYNTNITGENTVGGAFGLLGKNSNISNVKADVNISTKDLGGGVIGVIKEYSTANNISVIGKITGEKTIGGIFAEIYGNKKKEDNQDVYRNFVSYANLTSLKGSAAGITSLIAENAILSDCINYGNISGLCIGGIVAGIGKYDKYATWGVTTVSRCENHGNLIATEGIKPVRSGGIAYELRMYNKLLDCYSDGNVIAKEECGGIVGYNDRGYIQNCYAIGELKTEYYDSYVGGISGKFFSPTGPTSSNQHSTIKDCFITADTKFLFKGKPSSSNNATNKCCSEEPKYKESFSNLQYFASVSDIKLDSSWNPDVWEIKTGSYPKLKMAASILVNSNLVNSNDKSLLKNENMPNSKTIETKSYTVHPKIIVPEELELEP